MQKMENGLQQDYGRI